MKLAEAQQFLGEVVHRYPFPENAYEENYIRKHLERYKDSCDLIAATCARDRPLLSAGCEPGHIEILLKQFYGFTDVTGLSYRATDEFKARMDAFGIPIRQCDLETDPIPCQDKAFASVIFLEAIEHMSNGVPFVLEQIRRVLDDSGHLFLSTPNLAQMRNRFKLLKGKSINWSLHGTKAFFARPPHMRHNREYTAAEVTYLLRQAGFNTVNVSYKDYSPRFFMRLFNSLYPSFKGIMFFDAGFD